MNDRFLGGLYRHTPLTLILIFFVLSGLRDNSFSGNTIRGPWENLARFYETTSMCRSTEATDDQVKFRLFGFSLIGEAKDWLLYLSNGTIQTWKELEDKF